LETAIETWGKGCRRLRGKASKLEIITTISRETSAKVLDIGGLNISDLNKILKTAKQHKKLAKAMPTGRLKQPYIDILNIIFPEVKTFDKLPVASLQSLLGAFIDVG
jgi:hypothetical protein|tara:strand:- start:2306 stop:2626 length:321 start_codon:yes stop_codon:yes gene_type:complete